jgi:hypothetical protein
MTFALPRILSLPLPQAGAAVAIGIVAITSVHAESQRPGGEIRDLLAHGPASEYAQELSLFGQFAGDWTIRSEWPTPGGASRTGHGSVHIGWILFGTALQDVWEGDYDDRAPGERPQGFGTTIRFFDRDQKVWRVVWVAPTSAVIQTFVARKVGNEIVLEGSAPGGHLEKWIWSEMTARSFAWRSEESDDNGDHWAVTQRVWAKREG